MSRPISDGYLGCISATLCSFRLVCPFAYQAGCILCELRQLLLYSWKVQRDEAHYTHCDCRAILNIFIKNTSQGAPKIDKL